MKLRLVSIISTVLTIVFGTVGSIPEVDLGLKLTLLSICMATMLIAIVSLTWLLVRFVSGKLNDRRENRLS